ncbi:MAG: DMT family transporter [Planctomycetota bacterium]
MNDEPSPPPEPGTAARIAVPALLTGAVAIGFAPVLIRWSRIGPSATAFWRLTLALPFLWTWYALRSPGGDDGAADDGARVGVAEAGLLMLPGLFFAVDQALWYTAVNRTTAANATLLVNLAPLFVAPAAWLWLRERVRLPFFLGTGLALGGVWLLLGASRALGGTHPTGDAFAFSAAAFYAGYILGVKRLRGRFPVAAVLAWSTLSAATSLLLIATLRGEQLLPAGARGWLVVAALALICHIAGQGLITFSLAHLPAGFSSVSLLTQPVAAAALAWAILGEALGPRQFGGGALVLAGIFLARRGSRQAPARESTAGE